MLGPAWRALDIIERLERDLGVPVVHALPGAMLGYPEAPSSCAAGDRSWAARGGNAMIGAAERPHAVFCCGVSLRLMVTFCGAAGAADFYQGKQVTIVVGFTRPPDL